VRPPSSHKEPGKEDTRTQEAYHEFEKEEDSEEEDSEREEDEPHPQPEKLVARKETQDQALEKEDEESEGEHCDSEEEDEDAALVSSMTKTEQQEEDVLEEEKEDESKQVEDQALEKEDEESSKECCDSEDEDEDEDKDEDEDEVSVSPVPQACPTTKSDHAQQKEAVIEEDYDSEEDEDDALEREMSWSFWSSLARRKQSVPPPKFTGDERRALDPTDTRPAPSTMSTGVAESTSDCPPTGPEPQPTFTGINAKLSTPDNSNRESDSKSIHMREKFLQELQFLKFSGDRDTKPSTVHWFLQLVAEYVRLCGGFGVSQDDRLISTVLVNLSREPPGGNDRAYRWAISWIG
jgi:hypothetical protein